MIKRILILLFVWLSVLSFTACDEPIISQKDDIQQQEIETQMQVTETQPEVTEPQQKGLTPDAAVDIYMDNLYLWMDESEPYRYMGGFGYCLLDLDFDGILELIVSTTDGSIRLSNNRVFTINPDTLEVVEVNSAGDNPQDMAGYDFHYAGNFVLYKNKYDGSMFYLCQDLTRVNSSENYLLWGKVYSDDLGYHEIHLYSEYRQGQVATEYRYYENGESIKVSYDEYVSWKDRFFSEYEDMNLTFKNISGNEFNEADYSGKRALLLEAYKSFSYDGFSFPQF